MADLMIRQATEADVRQFAAWRHEAPYDVYNITGEVGAAVEYFLRPSTNCHVVEQDGELAAFFTFGSDAQVPGGDYSVAAVDIGLGVKPELTGRGLGGEFVAAVAGYAGREAGRLRVTIAAANERAIRVWSQAGFVETRRFRSSETVMGSDEFVMLER